MEYYNTDFYEFLSLFKKYQGGTHTYWHNSILYVLR